MQKQDAKQSQQSIIDKAMALVKEKQLRLREAISLVMLGLSDVKKSKK